jgi:predicted transposase YbfD/YdcC
VGATDFALFAAHRRDALSGLISYHRPPSHDTFSRLLRLLDPIAFEGAFARFRAGFAQALAAQGFTEMPMGVIAIGGKASRRAFVKGEAASPPLTVSAFATQSRLCLTAATQQHGENEVEFALLVVGLLDLTDTIITADALHCHHRMADAVTARGGDYLLALKGNRASWHSEAQVLFETSANKRTTAEETRRVHGRNEWRKADVMPTPTARIAGHAAYVRLTSKRDDDAPVIRHFMASKTLPPCQCLDIARQHWSIENNLHWVLDVHLGEDLSRARKDHAPANVALLKRLARNILQIADTIGVPISHRIQKCSWSDPYLRATLLHMR